MKILKGAIVLLALGVMLAACGGGGGGGGPAQPTAAVIKLSVEGTPSGTPIGGIQATVTLPSGVSVKATQNPPQTDDNVVLASGGAANAEFVLGTYSTSSNAVTVYVTKSDGIAVGEFATVNCDIAAGTFPTAADFSVTGLSAWDVNGATVTGLAASFTAAIN